MDLVLRNLPRTCVYLDGILVANEIEEQHRLDLIALFDTLETNGLIINKAKCVFGVKSLDFLRNQFYNNGIKPLPEKRCYPRPRPTSTQESRRFLGMVDFFQRFVPHAATINAPLYAALRGKSPPKIVE